MQPGCGSGNRNLFTPLEKVTIDPGTPNEEVVERALVSNPQNPAQPLLHAAAAVRARRGGDRAGAGPLAAGRRLPAAVRDRGKFEALEFAAGNYGLLESAYDYAKDETALRS